MNDNRIIQGTNGILLDSKLVLDPTKHQPKGRPQAKRLTLVEIIYFGIKTFRQNFAESVM
jgi:hypothetical protein